MNNDPNERLLRRVISLLIALIVAGVAYELISTIYIARTTGILVVNSPGAFLTVERDGNFFANIGWSQAKIRLKPGVYILVASKGKAQVNKPFIIIATKSVDENVNVVQSLNPGLSESAQAADKLISYLPFIGPDFDYEVNYTYNVTAQVALPVIVVTAANSANQQAALNWITAVGFNPTTLNIEYVNGTPQPLVNSLSSH